MKERNESCHKNNRDQEDAKQAWEEEEQEEEGLIYLARTIELRQA
jgi:hypothetical protein